MSEEPIPPCPRCGNATPAGTAFCPVCGLPQGAAPMPGGPPPPRQPLSPQDSRNWALAAHLTAGAGALVGGLPAFVGPLVIWMMRREDDSFSTQHALEALNFNITVLGIVIIGFILGIGTIGVGFLITGPLMLVAGVLWLIWTIQASMAASRGEPYRYPMSIRLVS